MIDQFERAIIAIHRMMRIVRSSGVICGSGISTITRVVIGMRKEYLAEFKEIATHFSYPVAL